jgi:hypothetical protein
MRFLSVAVLLTANSERFGGNEDLGEVHETVKGLAIVSSWGNAGSRHELLLVPVQVNASDDRSANTLKERILDAVQMQPVMGDRRPNCVVSKRLPLPCSACSHLFWAEAASSG